MPGLSVLEAGQVVLAHQPFSVLLGASLSFLGDGRAELRVPLRRSTEQQNGFTHGGVVAYAADNAMAFAAGTVLGRGVLTTDTAISYLRSAKSGELVARASVEHSGKVRAVCRCDVSTVLDGVERLCAVAQGTVVAAGSRSRR